VQPTEIDAEEFARIERIDMDHDDQTNPVAEEEIVDEEEDEETDEGGDNGTDNDGEEHENEVLRPTEDDLLEADPPTDDEREDLPLLPTRNQISHQEVCLSDYEYYVVSIRQ
jgi:hypothetical protein